MTDRGPPLTSRTAYDPDATRIPGWREREREREKDAKERCREIEREKAYGMAPDSV